MGECLEPVRDSLGSGKGQSHCLAYVDSPFLWCTWKWRGVVTPCDLGEGETGPDLVGQ